MTRHGGQLWVVDVLRSIRKASYVRLVCMVLMVAHRGISVMLMVARMPMHMMVNS